MNESLKKIRDESADAIFMKNRGFKLDELTKQDDQWSRELRLIKSGFDACYDLMISRMKYDKQQVIDQAKHEDSDGYFGFLAGAEWQFEQDLKNLKGE